MGKKVKLKIGETEEFTEGIIRLFTAMHLESARLILNKSHQHVSVHETRKNIKKIRGMLRLIRHEIGKTHYQELNVFYRDIAAIVAVLRDDTSQIELLQGMREAVLSPQVRRSLGRAIRQVKARRKNEFAHFYGSNTQLTVHNTLKAKAVDYEGLLIAGDPEAFILKGLKKTYRSARKALKASKKKSGSKEVYHDLRKQVKYLMYHMMTISNSLTTVLKEYILLLDRLSDYLGNLHDLDLFHEHLKEDELIKLEKDKKQTVLKYIYRRRAYLKRNTHKLGKTLFFEKSNVFANRVFDDWNSARQT